MTISRYPLAWPAGWPRKQYRKSDTFKITFDKAVSDLADAIERLGGKYPVLSTNLEIRLDGFFKRNVPEPRDPGVAVYFEAKSKQRVFACDTFSNVRANVRAIGLTIEALRSIERYGASDMLERALSAFDALPALLDPWQVLGVPRDADLGTIRAAFNRLAAMHHPDHGGSNAKMAELNRARDLALEALRKTG